MLGKIKKKDSFVLLRELNSKGANLPVDGLESLFEIQGVNENCQRLFLQ